MRTRRSILRSATVLGVAVSAGGLAGCTYDVGVPDAESAEADDPEANESGEGPDDGQRDDSQPDATEELATLGDDMGQFVEDMHEVAHDPDVAVDDRDLRTRVDGFGPRLDGIRDQIGSEEQADRRRTLSQLNRLLGTLVEAMEGLRNGGEKFVTALDVIFEAEDFAEGERLLDEAAAEVPRLGRADDQFREIRPDLAPFDGIDVDVLGETIERTAAISAVMDGVHRGTRTWSRGYESFLGVLADYDDGQYRDVARRIDRPESMFSQAAADLRETKAEAPEDMWEGFEPFICLFESFADAAAHYGNAAAAFLEGDEETGLAEEGRAESALDRCD